MAGQSAEMAYEPTMQERAREVMKGRVGLCWEGTNFAVSILVFAVYVLELYYPEHRDWPGHRPVELATTAFFVVDFALQLFVAPHPLQYLTSRYGIIDFLTIIPALVIWIIPGNHSKVVFVLRVLRVFRSLRILRLTQYIRFKKHGFEYELGVFVLSAVAVIFCAAGIFQEIESKQFTGYNGLKFHDAFYFILVTISTIGYGDIEPKTSLGHFFVIILIIGVFTIVPHQAGKLNELARKNHSWDKEFNPASRSSGHVIVVADYFSPEAALDFLQEFYHPTRGAISLSVVFLTEQRPTRTLIRALAIEKYRHKVWCLRGSLTSFSDQRRVCLSSATAVFFLLGAPRARLSNPDSYSILLQALSVRNCAISCGQTIDVYAPIKLQGVGIELSPLLFGASTAETDSLQNLLLSQAAVYKGTLALISNLLHSAQVYDFRKFSTGQQPWFQEYAEGMSHQLFPIVFSARFDFEKYEDLARNMYENYNVLLIGVHFRRAQNISNCSQHSHPRVRLAPLRDCVREGDIGFVIAKTASDVQIILNTYGLWKEDVIDDGRNYSFSSSTCAVRVSSENLLRRHSPRSQFRRVGRLPALRDISCSVIPPELSNQSAMCDNKIVPQHNCRTDSTPVPSMIGENTGGGPNHSECRSSRRSQLIEKAVLSREVSSLQRIFEEEMLIRERVNFTSHCIVSGGDLTKALSIISNMKSTTSTRLQKKTSEPSQYVVMAKNVPSMSELLDAINERSDFALLDNVFFLVGSSTRANDLLRAGVQKAQSIVILQQELVADVHCAENIEEKDGLVDFASISSLLALELAYQHGSGSNQRIGRLLSQRLGSSARVRFDDASDSIHALDNESSFYQREISQGLPQESVKLRVLERFPDLDPTILNGNPDEVGDALKCYGSQNFDDDDCRTALRHLENVVVVLTSSSSIKFCGPCDRFLQERCSPYFTPLFAAGQVLVLNLLDRIVCHSFYNPYMLDVVEALAGSEDLSESFGQTPRCDCKQIHRSRLFLLPLQNYQIGMEFGAIFPNLLKQGWLVIGIYRTPDGNLGNVLPFAYTCPTPDTILNYGDELFVLGEVFGGST